MSVTPAMPPGDHARRDEVLVFEICLRASRAMQRLRQMRRRCHHLLVEKPGKARGTSCAGAARTFAIGTEVNASSASASSVSSDTQGLAHDAAVIVDAARIVIDAMHCEGDSDEHRSVVDCIAERDEASGVARAPKHQAITVATHSAVQHSWRREVSRGKT